MPGSNHIVPGMLLQRMLSRASGWATVLPFGPTQAPRVQAGVELMSEGIAVRWRVVRDDHQQTALAVYDGRRWHSVGEALPATGDMPWSESGLRTASDWLAARQGLDDPSTPGDRKD